MSFRYRAFGATIEADTVIPGLLPAADGRPADLFVTRGAAPDMPDVDGDTLWHTIAAEPAGCTLRVGYSKRCDTYRFQYGDGAEFVIDGFGERIHARWPDDVGDEGGTVYLVGPVIGFALRLRGVTCLHAGAVYDGERCLAVVAPGGHGKSSITAMFARRGAAVLTDDLVALREHKDEFRVQPSHPRIRLWPDAVEGLFGSADALPLITPDDPRWDKRYLDLTGDGFHFHDREARLDALYFGIHDEDAERPYVEAVSPHRGLLVLLANTYSRGMPGRDMRAREFDTLARLAATVPLRAFHLREGYEHLAGLCDLLLDDCREQASARGSARAMG